MLVIAGVLLCGGLWLAVLGESKPGAPQVEYPAALSNFFPDRDDSLGDLAVDDEGVVWFPVLESGKAGQMNTLYRYDPAKDALQTFSLPNDPGQTYAARIDIGRGAREGKVLVVWEATVAEVDASSGEVTPLDVPVNSAHIFPNNERGSQPLDAPIRDIVVDDEGTAWISREPYRYLVAIRPDGTVDEYALPDKAGTPDRLALDTEGRVWATLFNHVPVPKSGGGTAYQSAFTLRFDPLAEEFRVLPWEAWSIAGGAKVIATGGDERAAIRRFDAASGTPEGLAEFGAKGRGAAGAEAAVGLSGDVWYFSYSKLSLVQLADGGDPTVFSLPTYNIREYLRYKCGIAVYTTAAPESCFHRVTTTDHVAGIAVAPDGSAWFSATNRIGHAIP